MTNILQITEILKGLSKEVLLQQVQNPGAVDTYLIISELDRRKRMEDAYRADVEEAETTVADDVISGASPQQPPLPMGPQAMMQGRPPQMMQGRPPPQMMQGPPPQMMQGRMPPQAQQGIRALPQRQMSPGVPPQMQALARAVPPPMARQAVPPMMMEQGGVVRMAKGGRVKSIEEVIESLTDEDKDRIARVVDQETGDDVKGIFAVTAVIINRLRDGKWGDSVKEVLEAKQQFEPVGKAGHDVDKLLPASGWTRYFVSGALFDGRSFNAANPVGGSLNFENPTLTAKRGTISKSLKDFYDSQGNLTTPLTPDKVDIGGNVFFTAGDKPLTEEEAAISAVPTAQPPVQLAEQPIVSPDETLMAVDWLNRIEEAVPLSGTWLPPQFMSGATTGATGGLPQVAASGTSIGQAGGIGEKVLQGAIDLGGAGRRLVGRLGLPVPERFKEETVLSGSPDAPPSTVQPLVPELAGIQTGRFSEAAPINDVIYRKNMEQQRAADKEAFKRIYAEKVGGLPFVGGYKIADPIPDPPNLQLALSQSERPLVAASTPPGFAPPDMGEAYARTVAFGGPGSWRQGALRNMAAGKPGALDDATVDDAAGIPSAASALLAGQKERDQQNLWEFLARAGFGTAAAAQLPGATALGSLGRGGLEGMKGLAASRAAGAKEDLARATLELQAAALKRKPDAYQRFEEDILASHKESPHWKRWFEDVDGKPGNPLPGAREAIRKAWGAGSAQSPYAASKASLQTYHQWVRSLAGKRVERRLKDLYGDDPDKVKKELLKEYKKELEQIRAATGVAPQTAAGVHTTIRDPNSGDIVAAPRQVYPF